MTSQHEAMVREALQRIAAWSSDKGCAELATNVLAKLPDDLETRRFPTESKDATALKVLADYLSEHGKLELLPQELIDSVKKAEERWRSVELIEEYLPQYPPNRATLRFEGLQVDALGGSRAGAMEQALRYLAEELNARAAGERLPTSTPPQPPLPWQSSRPQPFLAAVRGETLADRKEPCRHQNLQFMFADSRSRVQCAACGEPQTSGFEVREVAHDSFVIVKMD